MGAIEVTRSIHFGVELAMNSVREKSWRQVAGIGVLMALPLVIGAFRQPAAQPLGSKNRSHQDLVPDAETDLSSERIGQTSRAERLNSSAWGGTWDGSEPSQRFELLAQVIPTEVTREEASGAADTAQDSAPNGDDGDEPGCGDATSQFQQWSVDFDNEIRKTVVSSIMSQLNEATTSLDRRNTQIERLQVEAELYRSQIQHLRDRLKEWRVEKK